MEQITKLKMSVIGIKSGKSRALKAAASNIETVKVNLRSDNTDIFGIQSDLVVLADNTFGDDRSNLQGYRYYGHDTGHIKRTSGVSYTYFEEPGNTKRSSY